MGAQAAATGRRVESIAEECLRLCNTFESRLETLEEAHTGFTRRMAIERDALLARCQELEAQVQSAAQARAAHERELDLKLHQGWRSVDRSIDAVLARCELHLPPPTGWWARLRWLFESAA